MSALTVRLPNSIHNKIRELAKQDGISINQFLASAAAEKVSSILTVDYLEREAALGSRQDFERILKMVPDVAPCADDQLSNT
jgi:hypothetical protein